MMTTGHLPQTVLALSEEREDAGTGKSEKHRSEQTHYLVRNFPRNKKSIIPGKEVAFISALEAAQVRSLRGRQHF